MATVNTVPSAIDEYFSSPKPLSDQINDRLTFSEVRREATTHLGLRVWHECHLDGGIQRVTVDTTEIPDVPTIVAGRHLRSEVEWEAELVGTQCDLDSGGQLREYATYSVVEIG